MCKARSTAPDSQTKAPEKTCLTRLEALHAPHSPSPLSAFAGSFLGLGGLSGAECLLRSSPLAPANTLVFVGSFGALATLLYAAPAAPLGKPKNVFFGHIASILVALAVHLLVRPFAGDMLPTELERALVPALAIGLMVHLKIPHPPAAACVVVYVCLSDAAQQTPLFMLMPALVGCAYMVLVQGAVAACVRRLAPPPAGDAPPKAAAAAAPPNKAPEASVSTSALARLEALHAPHSPSPLSAFAGSFLGLGGLSGAECLLRSSPLAPANTLVFVASFGALATLLYAAPAAPLGKPKNVFFGHIASILIALAVHLLVRPFAGDMLPTELERALVPALAIGLMVHLKIPHPPAAACVVVYVCLSDAAQQTPLFMLMPALVGCAYMVLVQGAVAACVRRLTPPPAGDAPPKATAATPSVPIVPKVTVTNLAAKFGEQQHSKRGSFRDLV